MTAFVRMCVLQPPRAYAVCHRDDSSGCTVVVCVGMCVYFLSGSEEKQHCGKCAHFPLVFRSRRLCVFVCVS